MLINGAWLLALCLVSVAWAAPLATHAKATASNAVQSVSLRLGRCRGHCPVYRVEIYASGEVLYFADLNAKDATARQQISSVDWQRILDARSQLQALGAHIAAPCTHSQACAVQIPDWCHFSRRVARSKIHRLTKEADVPWEDEKFSYLAVSRQPVALSGQRVLMQPKSGGGKVLAKLCSTYGSVAEHLITKRDKALFAQARRVDWGDLLDAE